MFGRLHDDFAAAIGFDGAIKLIVRVRDRRRQGQGRADRQEAGGKLDSVFNCSKGTGEGVSEVFHASWSIIPAI
jgi:hypothetical protein